MDRFPSQEGPNPLRPYYIPPSIGPAVPANPDSAPISSNGHQVPHGLSRPAAEFLSDLSYGDYMTDAAPSITDILRVLLDQAAWKYTSVLLGHPFEVAKIVLQVCDNEAFDDAEGQDQQRSAVVYSDREEDVFADANPSTDSESDPDAPSYFSSPTPSPVIRRIPTRRTRPRPRIDTSKAPKGGIHVLSLPTPALTAVISQLWQRSGAWGVWSGANTSFVYKFLSDSLEMFLRGLLVAFFDIPEATALPVSESQGSAWQVITITTSASIITALLMSPIDIARTRLMLTPPTHPPRSLISSVSALPSPTPPPSLWLPTALHAAIPTLVNSSTPHILRNTFSISPQSHPATYSIFRALSSVFELGVRLPLETSLRRAQLSFGFGPKGPGETVVPIGKYRGVGGTLWLITTEEGRRQDARGGKKKGQGLEGVFRGWRVGIWGLVGVWGAGMIGGTGFVQGGEF